MSVARFNVQKYGTVGDGTHDDTAAIQAAINAAQGFGGGVVVLPPGKYKVTSTLSVTASNVKLQGFGQGATHNPPPSVNPATSLTWAGGASGPVLSFAAVAGGLNLGGNGVADLAILNPNGNGTLGLVIDTCTFGTFENLLIDGFTVHGVALQGTVAVNDIGGAQANFFRGINLSGSATGDALYLFVASHNTFESLVVSYGAGNGITLDWADFNDFHNVRMWTGGSGIGVVLPGSTSFSNRFYELSPGIGVVHAYPGSWNTIYNYDQYDNNYPDPIVDGPGPAVNTTIAAAVPSGVRTVTPGSMANITAGSTVRIASGVNQLQEDVQVTATTSTTFTARFRFSHAAGVTVTQSPAASLAWINDGGQITGFPYKSNLSVLGNAIFIGNNAGSGNATINAQAGQPLVLGLYNNTAGVYFGAGNGGTVGGVSTAGNAFFASIAANNVSSLSAGGGGHTFANNAGVFSGSGGAPTFSAPAGSLFLRTDGGSGARLYVSAGGGTWTAVSGV